MEHLLQIYDRFSRFGTWELKLAFCVLVIIVAIIASIALRKLINKALTGKLGANMPSASIFINVITGLIWAFAFIITLKPVFGIEPTAFLTALGVGGIALSFGLKDTIANLIGGLQLTLAGVVQPGDHIRIGQIEGTVHDITWRQTTVVDRLGETVAVPNSVLNTTAVHLIPAKLEAFTSFPILIAYGVDLDEAERDVTNRVKSAIGGSLELTEPPSLVFTGFNQHGITAEVWMTVKQGKTFGGLTSTAVKALSQSPYLAILPNVQAAAVVLDEKIEEAQLHTNSDDMSRP